MKVVLDLNVILDVVQKRDSLYVSSASVLELVVEKSIQGVVPGHLLTTLYFITAKHSSKKQADLLMDWMLKYFEVGVESRESFMKARSLPFRDFEDAVVASVAELEQCECIVTRNIRDFKNSPVPAVTPEELLVQRAWKER